jgi:hypothetical protein
VSSLPWDKPPKKGNLEALFPNGFQAGDPPQQDPPQEAEVGERTPGWYALRYARRGWPVFPLHSVEGSRCTCGHPDCGSPGKHPRARNGLRDATVDPGQIGQWWQRWPTANVAVATGAASGFWALDVDPRHGGTEVLETLVDLNGPLPETPLAFTGGGGQHYLFEYPQDRPVRNKAHVKPGLDVRGDGGYIVVEPSVHACGNAYAWLIFDT